MTPENFCYWLQGHFELAEVSDENEPSGLTLEQVQMIKEHLQLVFNKVTNPVKTVTVSPINEPYYKGPSSQVYCASQEPEVVICCGVDPGFLTAWEEGKILPLTLKDEDPTPTISC